MAVGGTRAPCSLPVASFRSAAASSAYTVAVVVAAAADVAAVVVGDAVARVAGHVA